MQATAIRGLMRDITLPNASGAVWIWVPTARALCGDLLPASAPRPMNYMVPVSGVEPPTSSLRVQWKQ